MDASERVRSPSGVSTDTLAHVADAVGALHTLARVTEWARSQRPILAVAEIVTQDEFTHDVVLGPWSIAKATPIYLVFDTT